MYFVPREGEDALVGMLTFSIIGDVPQRKREAKRDPFEIYHIYKVRSSPTQGNRAQDLFLVPELNARFEHGRDGRRPGFVLSRSRENLCDGLLTGHPRRLRTFRLLWALGVKRRFWKWFEFC